MSVTLASREVRLNLRLSGQEYAAIATAAKRRGLRPGTLAREVLLSAAAAVLSEGADSGPERIAA